jgi:hypothetical protein
MTLRIEIASFVAFAEQILAVSYRKHAVVLAEPAGARNLSKSKE